MARQRISRRGRSGARPNRGWSATSQSVRTTVPAASKVLLGNLAPATGGIDLTVLRTVGGVWVGSDQATLEDQIGAVGLIVVTDIAVAAGIASIPGPFTDAGDDGWFVHQMFAQESGRTVTSPAGFWYPIDSRAKRVLDGTGVAIAIVAENANASNGMTIVFQFRILSQVRGTQ